MVTKANKSKDLSVRVDDLEKRFPSIPLAYPLAVASYDQAVKRLDGVDSKNLQLLSFCLAAFLVFPTVANAHKLSFQSYWFYLAFTSVLISICLSAFAFKHGRIPLITPTKLFKDMLDLPDIVFKKDMIFHAGADFEKICNLTEKKWKLNTASLVFFLLAVILATIWLATATPSASVSAG